MTVYDLLDEAIRQANDVPQLKKHNIILELEVNAISKTVSILVNKHTALSVRCKTIEEGYVAIVKWLFAASMPIFKDVNIFDYDGKLNVLSNNVGEA